MIALRCRARAAVIGLSAAGTLAGHALAYLLVVPDAQARHLLLHATGHGYLSLAVPVAIVAGGAGLILTAARGARGEVPEPAGRLWRRLAAVQACVFLAVELVERGVTGHLPSLRLLLLGGIVQIVVAAVSALLLGAAATAGAGLHRALRRRFSAGHQKRGRRPGHLTPPAGLLTGCVRSRAPPVPV